MASVLVTGGAGFIGTHLCRFLHDNGHQVVSLDCDQTGEQPWECITADIRDQLQFDGIDAIVHLAAQVSVVRSVENPDETLSVNIDGTSSIISAAELSGVKRLLFASSAAVYGDSQHIPIPETAPLIPQSPYAVSKIVGEELCRRSEIETCAMRFFNVYGPGQSAEGGYAAVIPAFKQAIAKGDNCRIFGDGTQIRDFVHINDLVKVISLALNVEKLPSEMNIASGQPTSLLDLVKVFSGSNPEMKPPLFEEERPGDIHTSLADITRMQESLSIDEMVSLEEGLS
ncbi:MAG: NAD-dependent epimerase/dehydratase family protein [Euryarchaeota archaeon]|jgi:nucleoside-diphosphate-sugar epimerase|nr:NAD-dependent epimerase/dehydratase family protein [Euryarchaeota archaeon]MBT4982253.1 NAD-dependent epimerase/dehydratase family protein [Euryarchaeota archaeon]MBT5184655.1 NAD-dependent epimerase/dehydratase family protein [Euryarchaeota archaeon]